MSKKSSFNENSDDQIMNLIVKKIKWSFCTKDHTYMSQKSWFLLKKTHLLCTKSHLLIWKNLPINLSVLAAIKHHSHNVRISPSPIKKIHLHAYLPLFSSIDVFVLIQKKKVLTQSKKNPYVKNQFCLLLHSQKKFTENCWINKNEWAHEFLSNQ